MKFNIYLNDKIIELEIKGVDKNWSENKIKPIGLKMELIVCNNIDKSKKNINFDNKEKTSEEINGGGSLKEIIYKIFFMIILL